MSALQRTFGPLRVHYPRAAAAQSATVRGVRVPVGPAGIYVTFADGVFRYSLKADATAPAVGVSAERVLRELEMRSRLTNMFKVYLWTSGVVLFFALFSFVSVFIVIVMLLAIGAYFVRRWDIERRTSRIFYDVDNQEILGRLALCCLAGEGLGRAARLWHKYSSMATSNTKYHAGASALIQRTPTRCWTGSLAGIELNVEGWSIPIGPQRVLFLPDALFIQQGGQTYAIGYEYLNVGASTTQFVESEQVPPDSQVVDRTWRFTNKSGGPDLRFNNNHQLPVVAYGELAIASTSGHQVVLQSSNVAAAKWAANALDELIRVARTPAFAPPPTPPTYVPPRAPPTPPAPPAQPYGRPPPLPVPAYVQPLRGAPPLQPYRPPPPLPIRHVNRTLAFQGVPAATTGERFYGPDESLNVAGRTIPRTFTYVQTTATYEADASAIVTPLPVGTPDRAMPMPYWPRYSECDPGQRARYLDWMASGRADPNIPLGYVFIFFYGLERRVLVENADEEVVRREVSRLLDIYRSNRSFCSYASDFLAFMPLRHRIHHLSETLVKECFEPLAVNSEIAFNALVAWYFLQKKPLPADYAAMIASRSEDAKRGVVVTRSAAELIDLFSIRYREKFGDGLLLDAAKRALAIDYRPASPSLLGRPFKASLPDVFGRSSQFKKIVNVWNDCVDDLRKASARKGEAKQLDATAWAALPEELRAQYDHPDQDRWDEHIAALPLLSGYHLAQTGQLAKLVGIAKTDKISAAQMKKVAMRATEVGYAMKPDPRLRSKAVDWTTETLVWRSTEPLQEVKVYAAVSAMLSLAMAVAMADGVFTQEEQEVVNAFLAELFTLDDGMRARVEAMKQLMARDPSRLGSIAKTLRTTRKPAELAKVGRVLVAIAAADGTIAESEEKALIALYRNLGLPTTDLTAAIASTGARLERDAVVEVQAKSKGNGGVAIPPPPEAAPKLHLDQAAIEAILADTKDVAMILADVFDAEDAPVSSAVPSSASTPNPAPVERAHASEATTKLAHSLDVRYHVVLEEILKQSTWTSTDVRALADRHRMMPAAILDTVNAWSDDAFGDFLIVEEGADWNINNELLKVSE